MEIPTRIEDVVRELLGAAAPPTDEYVAQTGRAIVERLKTRHRHYHADAIRGGLVVKYYRDQTPARSWREIDRLTNIPQRTAGRWLKLAEDYLADPMSIERDERTWRP